MVKVGINSLSILYWACSSTACVIKYLYNKAASASLIAPSSVTRKPMSERFFSASEASSNVTDGKPVQFASSEKLVKYQIAACCTISISLSVNNISSGVLPTADKSISSNIPVSSFSSLNVNIFVSNSFLSSSLWTLLGKKQWSNIQRTRLYVSISFIADNTL